MQATTQKTQVTLDGEVFFPAVVGDERWNGFLVPLFDHDTAVQVCEYLNEASEENNGFGDQWTPNADGTFTHYAWDDALGGMNEVADIPPNEDGLVSIGGYVYSWTTD